jgi:hypothetical protein
MSEWDLLPPEALDIDTPGDDWIPLTAAAHIAGIPLRAMRRRNVDRGRLRSYKWYDGRRYVDRQELRDWMGRRVRTLARRDRAAQQV